MTQEMRGLEFLKGLVADMVQDEPDKRPSMDDVVSRFEEIRKSVPQSRLRSYLFRHNERGSFAFNAVHFCRKVVHMAAFRPAIPSPHRFRS